MSDGVGAGNDSYASSDTIINNTRPATVTPAVTARAATSLSLDATTTVEVTEKVTAYPNPFKDDVTLTISTQAAISKVGIKVFDLSGRPVVVKEVSNVPQGTSQINVGLDSRLTPGVYLLQIRNGDNGKVQVIKLVRK
jgi:methionine-rich copper-binding protein CopC